jgi:hypothetical protein
MALVGIAMPAAMNAFLRNSIKKENSQKQKLDKRGFEKFGF